jgi:hypothetical protein
LRVGTNQDSITLCGSLAKRRMRSTIIFEGGNPQISNDAGSISMVDVHCFNDAGTMSMVDVDCFNDGGSMSTIDVRCLQQVELEY